MGLSWKKIGAKLGIGDKTACNWYKTYAKDEKLQSNFLPIEAKTPQDLEPCFELLCPSGYRVLGLGLNELKQLLKEI